MDQGADPAGGAAGLGGGSEPLPEVIREQLERILASVEFVASDRLKGFLRFVVEETLDGRGDRLKAYAVAVEVFGREPGFDPQNDPVVRMEAGKLRRRLERYYLDAGRDDPVRIEIPKGTYVPTFSSCHGVDDEAELLGDGQASPVGHRSGRTVWWSLGGVVIAGLLLLTGVWLRSEAPSSDGQSGHAVPQERGPAILVLPFENLSGSEADEVFATGLTEELISNLMRFGELRLYSAYGSFQEEPTADPGELRRRLDVGYVVKGSVRRGPGQIRVTVHLIDAMNAEHLWSETYHRPLTPEALFALEEELAANLATRLAGPYGIIHEVTAESFRRQRPETLFAYECVLRAFAYRRLFDRDSYTTARACLEEAVRRDPGYADAWALLAFAHLDEYRFGYGPGAGDPAALDLALSTGRHAVELDADGVQGLLALSSVRFYRREFEQADSIHQRLLSLNPTNPEVLAQVGWRAAFAHDWNAGIGHLRQGIAWIIKAPDWYHMIMAFDHYRRGDYQTALDEMSDVARTKWVFAPLTLAAIHGQLGNGEEAAAALDQAKALNPDVLQDSRAALRIHNVPEDLIDQLLDGLRKAGLTTS